MSASSSAGIKVEALFDFKIGKDPSVSTKATLNLKIIKKSIIPVVE
jgi:hypothetical protein